MDVMEAIRGRRSIGRVKPDPVDRAIIEQLLEAAAWAPNHAHTEPWRFWVMQGDARKQLGKALADITAEELVDPQSEENLLLLKKAEAKALRAPVIIAAAVTPTGHPKVPEIEEVCAVSAAVQNLLLAAHAAGLGAIWRTGSPTFHPRMKQLFGLREQDTLLGFIYLGWPDMAPPSSSRTPVQSKTVWLDSGE